MTLKPKDFIYADEKSVDKWLPAARWVVYPTYEARQYEQDSELWIYVEAFPTQWVEHPVAKGSRLHLELDHSGEEVYSPMRLPTLFLEFARLVEEGPIDDEVVLGWVMSYGTLGVYEAHPDGRGGWYMGRSNRSQSVLQFARLVAEANRCLGLWETSKDPTGPNEEKLREYGVSGNTPRQLAECAEMRVWEIVNKHREAETFSPLVRRTDGTYFEGHAFWSLLGALYLQMSNLVMAPPENVRHCLWCRRIIDVRESEPPPADAPKGTRGKHRTHKSRKFCEKTNGILNACKNAFNYHRSKRAKSAP